MKEIKGFKNCNIYVEGKGVTRTSLGIDNGKIQSIGKSGDNFETLDEKLIVVPGFIDKHIHGANNSDSMYPTYKDIQNISLTLASEGITSYLPTTMTQSVSEIDKALANIRNYIEKNVIEGAQVLGIHLEGPFISKKFKGAQPEEYIIPCDVKMFRHFQDQSGNHIRMVTLAYEENGQELSEYLARNNILASIGHSNATADEVLEAVHHGVTSLTHSYNAMRGLHHREAGTIGGAMLADEIYCELIADLIHVSEPAIRILYRIKGKDRIVLVTDAMEAKHLPDGIYKLGGQDVYVKDNAARLENGALAGSTLQMQNAVRNVMKVLNLTLEDAVDLATINPARNLKIDSDKGSIRVGKDADFAVIDRDLNVYMTVRGGRVIYTK